VRFSWSAFLVTFGALFDYAENLFELLVGIRTIM
jgi:hypothetical protein